MAILDKVHAEPTIRGNDTGPQLHCDRDQTFENCRILSRTVVKLISISYLIHREASEYR